MSLLKSHVVIDNMITLYGILCKYPCFYYFTLEIGKATSQVYSFISYTVTQIPPLAKIAYTKLQRAWGHNYAIKQHANK